MKKITGEDLEVVIRVLSLYLKKLEKQNQSRGFWSKLRTDEVDLVLMWMIYLKTNYNMQNSYELEEFIDVDLNRIK